MTDSPRLVTLFADFSCPFCYVTEAALARLAPRYGLEIRARAFELFPSPEPFPHPPHAPADLRAVAPLAAEVELELREPTFRPRTRKAHETAYFAAERGAGERMRAAIYQAYWRDGLDVGRIDVLVALAEGAGLDGTELKIALDIDRARPEVLADLELARRLRVTGVPTLFVGTGAQAEILQGARSLAALDEALVRG